MNSLPVGAQVNQGKIIYFTKPTLYGVKNRTDPGK